jgi:hypothetical protein
MSTMETQAARQQPTAEDQRQDHLRRMEKTVQEMREQGDDFEAPTDGAPAPRRNSRIWIGALALAVFAEVAVLGVVSRMESNDAAPVAVAQTPCAIAVDNIEAALTRFRQVEGRVPGTLALLVPGYLPAIPKPAKATIDYQSQGEGYVLRCADAG